MTFVQNNFIKNLLLLIATTCVIYVNESDNEEI